MAQRFIVYWRDIPAQVIIRRGRESEKRELPERFFQAIDRAALRAGLRESDAYLAQCRRGEPEPCGDDMAAEADAALAALVQSYDDEMLDALVRNDGVAP